MSEPEHVENHDWAIVANDGSVVDRFVNRSEADELLPQYNPGCEVKRVPDPGML